MQEETSSKTLLLLGEAGARGIAWYDSYDRRQIDRFTEFQLAAFEMKISSRYNLGMLSEGRYNVFLDEPPILLQSFEDVNGKRYACMVFFGAPPENPDRLLDTFKQVLSRGVKYFARKFYSEVIDLMEGNFEVSEDVRSLTPEEAMSNLKAMDIPTSNKNISGSLLSRAIADGLSLEDTMFLTNVTHMILDNIEGTEDVDVPLDASFKLAEYYQKHGLNLKTAISLFEKIGETVMKYAATTRLGLFIQCNLSIASIIYYNFPEEIMYMREVLDRIDDGQLHEVGQMQWEEYYVLQGHLYMKMGDTENAIQSYMVAVEIADDTSNPSIHVAEAYKELANYSALNYNLEKSVQQSLAAWSIAKQYEQDDFAQDCMDSAAKIEMRWAEWLIYSSLVRRMEGRLQEAVLDVWRSMKLIITAYGHASQEVRFGILSTFPKLFMDIQRIVLEAYEDDSNMSMIARKTLADINENFALLSSNTLWDEEANARVDFLKAQISAMLPKHNPTFLLIANDGRLMCGGKVNESEWPEMSAQEDLLSGALSAIMALISEVTDTSSSLKSINAGETNILIEWTPFAIGALLTDHESGTLKQALSQAMQEIILTYDSELLSWDGFSLNFDPVAGIVNKAFLNVIGQEGSEL